MLKKLAILALMFGVILQNHVYGGQPATGAAQGKKPAIPTASASVQEHDSPAFQQDGSQNQNAHEPKSVRVVLPPKDNYDLWAFWISAALALAGFLGIGVGICTLLVLRRQTKATEGGAKAALLNAQAVLDSERAWLTAEVLNFEEPPPKSTMIWIEVPITNRGKTPARFRRIAVTSKLIPVPDSSGGRPGKLPNDPDYSDTNRVVKLTDFDLIIAPNSTFRHMHVFIYPAELEQMRAKRVSLYVYGLIEYLDTVKGESHETGFCSIYSIPEPNFNEPTGFTFTQYIPGTYFRAT